MKRDFNRLTSDELAGELQELEEKLASEPRQARLKNLVQNLRVHQIELEMQNRELREAQQSLQEAHDRYSNLYDFAPTGYITLDPGGTIREINLTAAHKLGSPRAELLGTPFEKYLAPEQRPDFFRHLRRTLDGGTRESVRLELRSGQGRYRWISLESVRALSGGKTVCHSAMVDITERMHADQARRETEARLALIADNVPVLISQVDANRRYMFNNAAYVRWFGHSRDHIRGRHMREVLGEEAYGLVKPYVDKVLSGEEVHFEADLPYQDGGARYVSGSYIPHRDQDGKVTGFFVMINDLSERWRAERALIEEQEFVSAVLNTAGALVAVFDRDGYIVRFNRECERVTGYSASEVEGRRFDMLLPPEERGNVEYIFQRLTAGDFPNEHENCWLSKSGEPKLISWSNTALTDSHGRVTHVIATGVDISERRRAETELRRRERQLRLVTGAVPVLIAYVDRETRYRFANAAYRDWLGLEPAHMVGRRVDELIAADTFRIQHPFIRRALRGEEVFYENVIHHKTLGKREVNAHLVPDHNPDGTVQGYFSVVTDITDRKRAEESAKRRLLEAAHADRLTTMGEMATEIAHELNQPLTAIATTADVCINRARTLANNDNDALVQALSDISAQAHRAAQIVKHVRTYARRREPEMAPVPLRKIVDSALSLVSVEARTGDITVDTDIPPECKVEADYVLIEQLLVNLARNAIEAMTSTETEAPRLSVAAAECGDTVDIRITDNGPGLSVEAREHLFEPFYTSKADGMGLGLAICRSIAEAHGGRMWADSPADGGAEFGFTLNAAPVSNQVAQKDK